MWRAKFWLMQSLGATEPFKMLVQDNNVSVLAQSGYYFTKTDVNEHKLFNWEQLFKPR